MSRTLTGNATAQKNSTGAKPRTIIKIEFGSPTGTKYYSDSTFSLGAISVIGAVVKWGTFSAELREQGSAKVVSDAWIELKDEDLTFLGYLRDYELQRTKATIYQWFEGLAAVDLVPLMSGRIAAPLRWDESKATVRIDITDIGLYWDQEVGETVSRDDFANIWGNDEDKVVPIVYGHVKRVPAVCIAHGAETTLANRLKADSMSFAVQDGSGFPQNTTITVKVDHETIRGQMAGNKFTVTTRGYILKSGSVTHTTGSAWRIKDTGISAGSGHAKDWMWKLIRVNHWDGGWQWNVITGRIDADTLVLFYPTVDSGRLLSEVHVGDSYQICGKVVVHEAGAPVKQLLDEYVWLACALESEEVLSVECMGRPRSIFNWDGETPYTGLSARTELVSAKQEYVQLLDNEYVVDLADAAIWAGHTCVSITMKTLPSDCPHGFYDSDALVVTMKGAKVVGGTYQTNPAKVIRDIMERFGGLTYPGDFDTTPYTAAVTALSYLAFGFYINSRRRLLDIVGDLAFQARMVVLWDAGGSGAVARFKVLYNSAETPYLTITNTTASGAPRELDKLKIEKESIKNIITRVQCQWLDKGISKIHEIIDATAEASFERQDKDINFWAYSKKAYLTSVGTWWLDRWKYSYEVVKLATYLSTLDIERGDTVRLTIPDFYTSQPAYVIGVDHSPGSGVHGEMDRINYKLQLPIYAGCSSTCEMTCETVGCETGCQIMCTTECMTGCESFACETSCQQPCEIVCVSGCELSCTSFCQFLCTTGDEVGCGSACQAGCEAGCESVCESSCESVCQYDCMTVCQYSCQSVCQQSGETCGTSCETVCQELCQTECQTACQTECQASCQVACQASCQGACQAGCQAACQEACQIACQVACQTTCQAGSCQATCQAGCELACQTTCELACQTACELACQVGCEVTCEVGCELTCETSCELVCETDCETFNEFPGPCETTCMIWCEAAGCVTIYEAPPP